jgi:hypothetical protein
MKWSTAMAEDRMMIAADVVANAMGGEHGDLLREAVASPSPASAVQGRPVSQRSCAPWLTHHRFFVALDVRRAPGS